MPNPRGRRKTLDPWQPWELELLHDPEWSVADIVDETKRTRESVKMARFRLAPEIKPRKKS